MTLYTQWGLTKYLPERNCKGASKCVPGSRKHLTGPQLRQAPRLPWRRPVQREGRVRGLGLSSPVCWRLLSEVDDLKAKLAIQEAELKQKNENADKLIHVVGVETEKVSKEKAVADEEEIKVEVINKVGSQRGFWGGGTRLHAGPSQEARAKAERAPHLGAPPPPPEGGHSTRSRASSSEEACPSEKCPGEATPLKVQSPGQVAASRGADKKRRFSGPGPCWAESGLRPHQTPAIPEHVKAWEHHPPALVLGLAAAEPPKVSMSPAGWAPSWSSRSLLVWPPIPHTPARLWAIHPVSV